MNDEMWEELWERTLDRVDRYRISRTTWRREFPLDPLEKRLVPELARRWRRSARNHAIGHMLWLAFWGSIAVAADPAEGPAEQLGAAMATFSLLVIVSMVMIRRYLAPVTEER